MIADIKNRVLLAEMEEERLEQLVVISSVFSSLQL